MTTTIPRLSHTTQPMQGSDSVPATPVTPTVPAALRTLGVRKAFGEIVAVDAVDLAVTHGEFLAVLGPSGCGKTTLLRLIAGFERPDAGGIEIGGRAVAGPRRHDAPERRRVGMVFQESALFPHLDVAGNIGFGLPRRGRTERVAQLTALVGLSGLSHRMPHELSGGQQQRVALARALAPEPELILLDEPFSGIDATLRSQLREEVAEILRAAGVTVVLVTHDREEALTVGDRVAVMRNGRLEQVSSPDELYLHPANRFVARFVGPANLVRGVVVGGELRTPLGAFRPLHGRLPESGGADVLLRPEQLDLSPAADASPDSPLFEVTARSFRGPHVRYRLRDHDGLALEATAPGDSIFPIGSRVSVRPRSRRVPIYRD